MIAWASALAGCLSGVLEASMLRRTVRAGPLPFGLLLRLLLVGGALVIGAMLGSLASVVAGWLVGFGVSVGVVAWRWT